MTNINHKLKSRNNTLPTKVHLVKAMDFSSRHVWMWELDHKEGWAPKSWCFQTLVVEKALESFLDCKEIKPVNPKGNQSWIFIGRTGVEAEAPILWPPDVKNWLIWKDPDTGKDWRREEKGMTEDEIDGWMASPTQWRWVWARSRRWWRILGSLACCSLGHKELDMPEPLKKNSCWLVILNIFSCICCPLVCLLWEISIQIFCPFLNLS